VVLSSLATGTNAGDIFVDAGPGRSAA